MSAAIAVHLGKSSMDSYRGNCYGPANASSEMTIFSSRVDATLEVVEMVSSVFVGQPFWPEDSPKTSQP